MNNFPTLKEKCKNSVLFLAFLLISCFGIPSLSAQNLKENGITLEVRNESVEKVFSQLTRLTNFKFFYDQEVVSQVPLVSLNVNEATLKQVLDNITSQTKLYFNRINNTIAVSTKAMSNEQRTKTISGVILDEKGEPVIGATVSIEGTSRGTITNAEGEYSLSDVLEKAKIVVSYIGYRTLHLVAGDKRLSKIILTEDSEMLEEVVVTALGIKRSEKALGYSVQKVKSESLQKVAGVDVSTSLTGKVAGLLVKNSTDFAAVPTLAIRGESPLIVIDGVPYANMTMRDVVADDIESISVLKGATASALYGNRGASGAVMITTKSGAENKEPISISLASNTMFSAGFLAIPEKQAMYGRGTNNKYDKDAGNSWGAALDGTIREQWDPYLQAYREYEYTAVGWDNVKSFI